MQPRARDFLVGLFLLAGIAAIALLSFSVGGSTYRGPGGLELSVTFDQVGGLKPRAPVVIGGVKVGQVKEITLSPTGDFRARVLMDVDQSLKLPDDTAASILTQGVLGSQYVGLEPGGSETLIADGGEITYTQSAVVIERLIGRVIQSLGNSSGGSENSSSGGDGG
jgi:phospholipid/cholesterol/gamma-HCH transport system substrate-binding protein